MLFKTHYTSTKSKARLGTIITPHGVVHTPTFVPCATKGTLKGIPPQLIPELGVELMFVNTYHLVTHPGAEIVKKAGGIHTYARLPTALMSDSGGFQVFSLGQKHRKAKLRGDSPDEPLLIKISDDGVKFRSVHDGTLIEFTPEKSIEYQRSIGADLMMAFDECTYYLSTEKYAHKSMERTHAWLLRCIKENNILKSKPNASTQHLYGIIQGGQYEDLRKTSAAFVTSQDVDGIAIGGVSVGETKKEMRNQVAWCTPHLPKDKPVHLLGIGQLDDLLDLVGYGIDSFDCVEPTRIARIGRIYQWNGLQTSDIDLHKSTYKNNLELVDSNCICWVCKSFTKSYLHHLFKQRELLGYTLATYHNLYTMERYMKLIRDMIAKDKV